MKWRHTAARVVAVCLMSSWMLSLLSALARQSMLTRSKLIKRLSALGASPDDRHPSTRQLLNLSVAPQIRATASAAVTDGLVFKIATRHSSPMNERRPQVRVKVKVVRLYSLYIYILPVGGQMKNEMVTLHLKLTVCLLQVCCMVVKYSISIIITIQNLYSAVLPRVVCN